MDNQAYLNQISQRPLQVARKPGNKFLTPDMIKLCGGLLVAVILLIVVMNILGQSGARVKALTEGLYSRMSLLSENSGPIDKYGKGLYSSDLRAMNGNLRTNLSNAAKDLERLLPDLGITPSRISAGVSEDEEAEVEGLVATLEVARLNAVLDRTYSSEMTLQIAELRAMVSELAAKSSNQAFLDLLHRIDTNLEALEIEFTDFTNRN